MRTSITSVWLLGLVVSICASGCSGAQGLVGLWRTEAVRRTPTGRTNIVEAYDTVEFLKDGSFKISGVITTDGDKRTGVVFSGSYTLIDTNHVRLEVVPNSKRPDSKIPLTVSFTISGDQLEMDALTSSVVSETKKYRRAKR